jgi:predicted PurR-regulated permease PerM
MNTRGFLNTHHVDLLLMILILIIFLGIFIALWPLIDALVLSISVAIVLLPAHQKICTKISESISAIFMTISVFFLVGGLFLFTAGMLYRNSDFISEIISTIISWVRFYPDISIISSQQVASALEILASFILGYLQGFAMGLPMVLMKAFIFFTSLYLFILKGNYIKSELLSVLPDSFTGSIKGMADTIVHTLYAVYIVNAQVAIITFLFAIPFFFILGYGHVLFLALLMGIFQLIPFLGPQLLLVFLAIYAVARGDISGVFFILLIGYPLMSGLEDFYFRPRMMGSRVAIHPVLMMIGIFGGLAILGIIGLILGPLFVSLLVSAYQLLIDQLRYVKTGERT